jgi:hypothetical protein
MSDESYSADAAHFSTVQYITAEHSRGGSDVPSCTDCPESSRARASHCSGVPYYGVMEGVEESEGIGLVT